MAICLPLENELYIEPANGCRERGRSSLQHIARSLHYRRALLFVCPPCHFPHYCMHDNIFMAIVYLEREIYRDDRIQKGGNRDGLRTTAHNKEGSPEAPFNDDR